MTAQPPLTTRRVLLGLFVVWQLVFIVGTNFNSMMTEMVDYLPPEWKGSVDAVAPDWTKQRGQLTDVSKTGHDLSARYYFMTGQEQIWSLFSAYGTHAVFVAVEFRWDEAPSGPALSGPAPVLSLSDNEPASMESYFRWGRMRLRRVEGNISIALVKDQSDKNYAKRWAASIEDHVRTYNAALLAYLNWRWRHYLQEHPGTPVPQQVIFHVRRYQTREPDETPPYLDGPFSVPVACWRPGATVKQGNLPVEAYDPLSNTFKPIR